jgi:hypothetical protein
LPSITPNQIVKGKLISQDTLASERNKVEWLGGDTPAGDENEKHVMTAAPPVQGASQYRFD